MVEAEAARFISTTPIPRLDSGGLGLSSAVTPLERIPRVDEHHCVGCNLCSLVCPVENCITMERLDNGLPFESWEERSANGLTPSGTQRVTSTNS
jgi:dihydropyrimidine dehydrogenase (NAD+) subunit PreA